MFGQFNSRSARGGSSNDHPNISPSSTTTSRLSLWEQRHAPSAPSSWLPGLHARAAPPSASTTPVPPAPTIPPQPRTAEQPVLMDLIIEDYLPSTQHHRGCSPSKALSDREKEAGKLPRDKRLLSPRELTGGELEGPQDGTWAAGPPCTGSRISGTTSATTTTSSSSHVRECSLVSAPPTGTATGTIRDRNSFVQRMKGWKRELWDALTLVDRHVKKKAEEDHRELSDGEKKHSVKEFKQSYMPTREAARAVLDPRYAGHCLGTDMNKLACEGLLSEAPTVLKAAVDAVPQKLEEVIALSSNLLDELIEQAKRENASGDPQQGVRLHKFLEFYKGYKERSLRTRMDRLKYRIQAEAATLVQEACSEALSKEVLRPAEQSRPASVVGYHQLLDSSLPRVPLAAAQAIQARVSDLVGRALAEVDEIQSEILPPMPDAYASLANKLRKMVIEDEPHTKKPRTETIDLTQEEDRADAMEGSRGEPMGDDAEGDFGVIGACTPVSYVRSVSTLVDLCIGTCAHYVDYLPDMPDGWFPEDLLQRMLTLLIERGSLSESGLQRLMSSSMTALSLRGWKQLSPVACATIAQRSAFLRRLDLSGCSSLLDEGLSAVLGAAGSALVSLSVEGCVGLTDASIRRLALCPNLLSLDASSCSRITDAVLRELPLYCPRLAALHLRRCSQITDDGLSQLSRWTDLTMLDLWENLRLTDRVLLAASSCAKLETVRVCGRLFSDAGMRALTTGCHGLRNVDIAGASLTDVSLRALLEESCARLVRLSIPHCSRVTEAAFGLLPEGLRLSELEEIDVSRVAALGDDFLRAITLRCPRLHRLSLMGCEQISDVGLTLLAGRCRLLSHVSIAQCKQITDRGVCAIIRSSNGRLRALSLENCHLTTDASLFALAETNCSDLVDLDLSGCDAITDEGIRAVVGTCTALEGLSVEELSGLTEEGISLLGRLRSLKRLRIGYSKGLSDAALATIAARCGDLQSLDLAYCSSPLLTSTGIETALQKLPHLEALSLRGTLVGAGVRVCHSRLTSLNLSWCKTLTDEALERLADNCSSLKTIDLAWCDQITGAAVHRLAQKLASLRTFNLRGCHKIPSLTIQFLTHAGKTVQR